MAASHGRARGAALVTALVIAALTAAAAVAMASRTQLEIARTSSQIDAARRAALVARVEAGVRESLRDAARSGEFDPVADQPLEQEYTASAHDIAASASLQDEQRRFNLNNLAEIARLSGGRAVVRSQASDEAGASGPVAAGSVPSSRSAAGERSSDRQANVPTPSAAVPGDSGANEHAGPEFVEKTRVVLDPSVAELVGGRGRPSELAALVAQSGAPRVTETYLERVDPMAAGPGAAQSAGVAETANPAVGGTTVSNPARVEAGDEGQTQAATPSPQAGAADGAATPSRAVAALWELRFSLLLERLEIAAPIAQAVLDWVDADAEVRFPNGAEDAYYLKLETPYRAANRPFSDVSELLLVRGVTPDVYAQLAPFVTVLPGETAININTAPAEVLMSLAPEIDRRTADLIIAARKVQPFRSLDALLALPMLAMTSIDPTGIDVDSEFFAATTALERGVDIVHSRALIARARNGNTRIVSRHNGYFHD